MIYAYVRVSTEKQSVENQRFEIEQFVQVKGLKVDQWVGEVISGTKSAADRQLGRLLKKVRHDDILIITELSRLGRNLMQIMSLLHHCMEKQIVVLTVKERYELGNNINSRILAFAFSLSAEIERNLISMRTREALARRRAEGIPLGRPKGKRVWHKIKEKDLVIRRMINNDYSLNDIACRLGICRQTLRNYLKEVYPNWNCGDKIPMECKAIPYCSAQGR